MSMVAWSTLVRILAVLAGLGAWYFLLAWLQESARLRKMGYTQARAERAEEEYVKEARGSLVDRMSRRLRRAGYEGDPAPVLAVVAFMFLVVASGMSILGADEKVAIASSAVVSPIMAVAALRYAIKRRRDKGARQMLQLIRASTVHLRSGLSAEQSFMRAAEQVGSPLREDVTRAFSSKVSGVGIAEAFNDIKYRYPSEATDLLVASLDINESLGAQLGPSLERAEEILSERQELSAEATAEMASVRGEFIGITAVVTVVALLLARQPLAVQAYTTPLGFTAVAIAALNYALGIFRAMRMFSSARVGGS